MRRREEFEHSLTSIVFRDRKEGLEETVRVDLGSGGGKEEDKAIKRNNKRRNEEKVGYSLNSIVFRDRKGQKRRYGLTFEAEEGGRKTEE